MQCRDKTELGNLEVCADLCQVTPGDGDVIGLHQLPLEDGQRDVRAGGEVTLPNLGQVHGLGRRAVALGRTLELHHLHVSQSL